MWLIIWYIIWFFKYIIWYIIWYIMFLFVVFYNYYRSKQLKKGSSLISICWQEQEVLGDSPKV